MYVKKLFADYKMRRFIAFIVDCIIIMVIVTLFYTFCGFPDVYKYSESMDTLRIAQGTALEKEAVNAMNTAWNNFYIPFLLIVLGYELLTALVFSGASIGKLICKLKIVANSEVDGTVKIYLKIVLRGVVKIIFIYLTMIPFAISALSIFANKERRAGIDFFAGTKVIDTRINI